jgi:hypothetical protein
LTSFVLVVDNYSQSTLEFLSSNKSEELDMELAAATIRHIHQNKVYIFYILEIYFSKY